MEHLDQILTILGIISPLAFGAAGLYLKKLIFLIKVAQQAVSEFEEVKEANQKIYDKIQADPNKKELAQVLRGGVKKVQGLTGLIE